MNKRQITSRIVYAAHAKGGRQCCMAPGCVTASRMAAWHGGWTRWHDRVLSVAADGDDILKRHIWFSAGGTETAALFSGNSGQRNATRCGSI